jgi:hypothetical protein
MNINSNLSLNFNLNLNLSLNSGNIWNKTNRTKIAGPPWFNPLCPRRCSTGALPAPVATTPWLKDILDIAAAQQAESFL